MVNKKNVIVPQYFKFEDGKSICLCSIVDNACNKNHGIEKKPEDQCRFMLQVSAYTNPRSRKCVSCIILN